MKMDLFAYFLQQNVKTCQSPVPGFLLLMFKLQRNVQQRFRISFLIVLLFVNISVKKFTLAQNSKNPGLNQLYKNSLTVMCGMCKSYLSGDFMTSEEKGF